MADQVVENATIEEFKARLSGQLVQEATA